jgi:UDP-2-acetamido-2,6-beta-L-arabino-hexul-4-ose reductase
MLNLVYIDDVVDELIRTLDGQHHKKDEYCEGPVFYHIKLGELAEMIRSFRESRKTLRVPDMSDGFAKKLFSTYLSYLPCEQFHYPLKMNIDNRGSFTEFIKTPDRGQISVNISRPGVTKGNHWHNTKIEKFLVVSGKGVIRFRKSDSEHVIEYPVNAENLEVIDIPPGYAHHIENLGDTDLITIIWANEQYEPDKPDTYFLKV